MKNQYLDYKSDNNNYQTTEDELYLKDYLIHLRIHLKKIILIFIIALFAGIYVTYSKIPKYRATATVLVTQKPGSQSLQNFGNSNSDNEINNKILLIKSRALLKLVVKQFWESTRRNNMFLFGTKTSTLKVNQLERWLKSFLH